MVVLAGLVAYLLLPAAQAACPKVKQVDDPFDGTLIRSIETDMGTVVSERGTITLRSFASTIGATRVVLPAGYSLELKLADDSSVVLTSLSAAVPTSRATEYAVYTSWQLQYGITVEQLERLATLDMTASRYKPLLNPDSAAYDMNIIAPKMQKKLRASFRCALEMVES